ncbi:MAG: DNA polymerase IV [Clostridiales bacterium GWB2_37_7]|nr:MAG: DNA polymerase IV [Clostridiales bacterium GWB2_37_7]
MNGGKYTRTIMHIDVNSAFLSWQAVYNLQKGDTLDLREIPSVVGGAQADRRGIVLAKSTPAKAYGIQTGEVLWQARQKCPNLVSVPANYELYMKCSNALYELVKEYSPKIQRFSVDEMFVDYTGMERHFGEPVEAAHMIKDRIKQELGFTVNVGIGCNKLTAKVAGDLKKPDRVHTLYPLEIPHKMWPLPVEDLFMVGRQTKKKLNLLNIHTIGQLANADRKLLNDKLKSFGTVIWCYANGIDESPVQSGYFLQMKGIGNSTTIRFDVTDSYTACKVLLSLTESVALRLRAAHSCCRVVCIEIRNADLENYSHQRKLFSPTSITNEIYRNVVELFKESWRGEKIRHLGVRVTDFCSDEFIQPSFFDEEDRDKKNALDSAIDDIRYKYGNSAVMRGVFLDGEFSPMTGGSGAEDYPVMSCIL